ncbi:hypothetical protein [Gordonia hongkongensis]|uniref:hypothetical protein n=1 Tax=Gordonia hongkongensis TaxID=1701090 RepID=UPI003D72316B
MPPRKRTQTRSPDTVTVVVTEPYAVYHRGEQRTGTLTDVPADLAAHWQHRGWVTITT